MTVCGSVKAARAGPQSSLTMQLVLHLLHIVTLTSAIGIYNLPPVPSQLTVPASVATYAASVASAQATGLSTHNNLGISTGTPNASLPDPCGPPNQPSGTATTHSTCHADICTNHTTLPQKYGATCLLTNDTDITPITQVIDANACANAMIEICYTIAGSYGPPAMNKWVFTNGTTTSPEYSAGSEGGGNCTVGFWLPSGGAPAPSFLRCVDSIFSPLLATCGGKERGSGSGGSVNLQTLPSFGVATGGLDVGGVDEIGASGSTGMAVDAGYPSYLLVA